MDARMAPRVAGHMVVSPASTVVVVVATFVGRVGGNGSCVGWLGRVSGAAQILIWMVPHAV